MRACAHPNWGDETVGMRGLNRRSVLRVCGNQEGQTLIEYLLLTAFAFAATYLVVSGPINTFTRITLLRIRGGLQNTIRNGEWREDELVEPGEKGHPGDPARHQPLHL